MKIVEEVRESSRTFWWGNCVINCNFNDHWNCVRKNLHRFDGFCFWFRYSSTNEAVIDLMFLKLWTSIMSVLSLQLIVFYVKIVRMLVKWEVFQLPAKLPCRNTSKALLCTRKFLGVCLPVCLWCDNNCTNYLIGLKSSTDIYVL